MRDRGPRMAAPDGLRWATGGGSTFGECNGYHYALPNPIGTLCGRIGPHTPPDPPVGTRVCGNCTRILAARRRKESA